MDMATAQERRIMRERTSQMTTLAYLIYRQWWRPAKNRQRRREMAALMAEWEKDGL